MPCYINVLLNALRKQQKKKLFFASEHHEMSSISAPSDVALPRGVDHTLKQIFDNTFNFPLLTVPPTILGFPSHLSPTEGEGVRIEVKVEGHPPPTLVWYHNGEAVVVDYSIEIDGQGNLFFPSIEFKHSGVYKVIATNTSGKVEKEVTVSVMSEGCDCGEGGGSEETQQTSTSFRVWDICL